MIRSKRFGLLGVIVGVNILGILFILRFTQNKGLKRISNDKLTLTENDISTTSANNKIDSEKNEYKYKNFDIWNRSIQFQLSELNISDYFRNIQDVTCFINGTDWYAMRDDKSVNRSCNCLGGWYGDDCGIPEIVQLSLPKTTSLVRRNVPRRVIHGLNVHHEIDLFDVRVHELQDVVDVYLLCESNFTAYGDGKQLYFLENFRGGFLREFQDKIVYVFQHEFPEGGRDDGWIADNYQRTFLTQRGLKQISGFRNDDLLLLLDADEIPKREIILFLKLYDGYPEPICFSFRWSIFGFFWHVPDKNTRVCAVSSMNMFRNAMADDGKLLRRQKMHPSLKSTFKAAGGVFNPWTIGGNTSDEAGWHCSWCLSPRGIRQKLISAQNGDKPRWGDYPEKQNLTYIKQLIKTGTWFDDESHFEEQNALLHVPNYVYANRDKFIDILENRYVAKNKSILVDTIKRINNFFKIW